MKSKFTKEERAKIVEEAKSGSVSAVARKYGTRANVVYNWLRKDKKSLVVSAPKKTATTNKAFNEVAFLKSELEKKDRIILQLVERCYGQRL